MRAPTSFGQGRGVWIRRSLGVRPFFRASQKSQRYEDESREEFSTPECRDPGAPGSLRVQSATTPQGHGHGGTPPGSWVDINLHAFQHLRRVHGDGVDLALQHRLLRLLRASLEKRQKTQPGAPNPGPAVTPEGSPPQWLPPEITCRTDKIFMANRWPVEVARPSWLGHGVAGQELSEPGPGKRGIVPGTPTSR